MERIIDQRQIGILLAAINGSLATFKEHYDQGKYSPDTLLSLLGGVQALRDAMEGELPRRTLMEKNKRRPDDFTFDQAHAYAAKQRVLYPSFEFLVDESFRKEDAYTVDAWIVISPQKRVCIYIADNPQEWEEFASYCRKIVQDERMNELERFVKCRSCNNNPS